MTITPRPRKGRNKMSYTVTIGSGKKRQTIGTFHTKAEAVAVEHRSIVEKQQRGSVKVFKDITVAEMIEKHIAAVEGKDPEKSTVSGYRGYLGHFTDFVGASRSLTSVDVELVEAFITYLSKDKKLAPLTVNLIVQQAGALYKTAIRYGFAHENPVTMATNRPKRVLKREVVALEVDEHERLVGKVLAHYKIMFMVWPFIAARPSEMSGLKIKDYDVKAKALTVERQWKRGGYTGLKHDAIPRTIGLDDATAALLDRQIGSLKNTDAESPLFPSVTGIPINQSYFGRKVFRPAAMDAGLGDNVTPHTMRHTGATWMLYSGAPMQYVAFHLGHSDPSVTSSTYSHLLKSQDAKAMSRAREWMLGVKQARNAAEIELVEETLKRQLANENLASKNAEIKQQIEELSVALTERMSTPEGLFQLMNELRGVPAASSPLHIQSEAEREAEFFDEPTPDEHGTTEVQHLDE